MDLQSLQLISNNDPVSITKTTNNVKLPADDSFWGSDGFTFGDLVDMFNPMQHIPVISKYYREQTLDGASEGSKLVGGVFFGGLVGGVSGVLTAIANSAVRHETHQDMGEHILEMAEQSLENITSSAENESRKMQILSKENATVLANDSTNNNVTNPFFAQTLEDYSNAYSRSTAINNLSGSQQSRIWGKV